MFDLTRLVIVTLLAAMVVSNSPIAQAKHGSHGNPHWRDKEWQEDQDDHGNWHDRDSRTHVYKNRAYAGNWVFTAQKASLLLSLLRGSDTTILSDDFRHSVLSQQQLPPGMQNRLAKGKPLPPGIAKKLTYWPTSVNQYVGFPYNANYRIGTVGRNIILYDLASGVVRDILFNRF